MSETNRQLSEEELQIARDIFDKLEETNQIYIIGHDYPISVSHSIFKLLQKALEALATAKGVPVVQLEMEDLFGVFLGIIPLNTPELAIMKVILSKLS